MPTPSHSVALFERAQETIFGGVNSPVRASRSVDGTPRFTAKVIGPYLWGADGTRYIGYVSLWGPMIVGHVHPDVVRAVQDVVVDSFSLDAPTEAGVVITEEICKLVPSIEQVRLVSSGIEATMSALRLARGFTGRDLIVKFKGYYHGHADSLLIKAGSGLLTFTDTTQNASSSAGVPENAVKRAMALPHSDVAVLREAFTCHDKEIATVIVEPAAGNVSLVRGSNESHQVMHAPCTEHDVVLIFDEVMTDSRAVFGCVQALYRTKPDLTYLSKVIGGGMPVAASDGRRDITGFLAPLDNVCQVGTLLESPLAATADLITLRLIAAEGFHGRLTVRTRKLVNGLTEIAREAGVPFAVNSVGGMFGIYFRGDMPTSFAGVTESDVGHFNTFFHVVLGQGIYLVPSVFEAGFVSATHDDMTLNATFEAAQKAFKGIRVSCIWGMGLGGASPVSPLAGTERGVDHQQKIQTHPTTSPNSRPKPSEAIIIGTRNTL